MAHFKTKAADMVADSSGSIVGRFLFQRLIVRREDERLKALQLLVVELVFEEYEAVGGADG